MVFHDRFEAFHAIPLRVEDFLLLADSGAFRDHGKVELVEGEIVALNAQYRPHLRAKMALYDLLRDALRGTSLSVFTEGSIAMPPGSVLEPDVLVTDSPDGDGLVPLSSVRLAVEIADTTLTFDLGPKRTIYAQHQLPEYWVVDLKAECVHQLWSPDGDDFAHIRKVAFGCLLTAETIDALALELSQGF